MKKLLVIGGAILVLLIVIVLILRIGPKRLVLREYEENALPRFVTADFIELDKVASISKFRSGVGHDFSGSGETCRSMKHYYNPLPTAVGKPYRMGDPPAPIPDPATATKIFSPVAGRIVSISAEHTPIGKQFSIRPKNNPDFTIRLFHVYPLEGIKSGSAVSAGQQIGTIAPAQGTDIAVETFTPAGDRFFSYFQVMSDELFADYQKRGLQSRADVILTKAQRDANPLQCHGEQFAKNYQTEPGNNETVHINGYTIDLYDALRGKPNN